VPIRGRKSAICGTDVHIWNWDEWSAKTVPVSVSVVVGHEFMGEVVELGAAVTDYHIGQHVSAVTLRDVTSDIGMSEGFDVGLEMSGAPAAMRQMIARLNNGGKLALLGIAPADFPVDWNSVIFKMLLIKGIYGREMFETWYKMIALIQTGLDLSGLITHRIGIDNFASGFDAMRRGQAGKVVMDWGV